MRIGAQGWKRKTTTLDRLGEGSSGAHRARISKTTLARCAALTVAGCIALAVPDAPARAGFFDFLFPPAPVAPAPIYRRARPHFYHREAAHFARPARKIAAAKHRKTIEAKASLPPRVIDLMDDESLRNGDGVMTQEGLRIFVGAEGSHHGAEDFAKVSETEGLTRSAKTAYLAVDAGLQGAATEAVVVTGRSAADTEISAGVPIVDARGHTIRYVGP